MQEVLKKAETLQKEINAACEQIKLEELVQQYQELGETMQVPDFWSDTSKAQSISKKHAALEVRIAPWQRLQKEVAELVELARLDDPSIKSDLETQYTTLGKQCSDLKKQLQFSGPYDDHNAILQIYAGAGGTDAQDWAQMLMRMYVRWAESHNYDVAIIEQSNGEEAGLKSVTIELTGPFAFGKLKGEGGVHRLVRLSPFNADNLRQTSFAKVDILPAIEAPEELQIDEGDLKIDVYRSGGHGGQSVNTTDSAVRITHLPTGITVAIQNERSQLQNKETAMTILRSRLAQLQLEQHKEKLSELKGPNQSAEWGNQIRSYVLHPYKQVKDLRTKHESKDPDKVLDGAIDEFITVYAEQHLEQ